MKKIAMTLFALATGCVADGTTPGSSSDSSSDESDSSSGSTGTASTPRAPRIDVKLTDAPGDFEEVWVDIARVEVGSDAGWLTVTEEMQSFDLLTLQNDVTAALGGTALAPGAYSQVRMIVDRASVVVAGEESPLTIASGAETGIKIPLDATFEENMTYSITLDFDAHKSVKSTGQGWLMTPVIHVKDFVATPMPADPTEETPTEETPGDEPIL